MNWWYFKMKGSVYVGKSVMESDNFIDTQKCFSAFIKKDIYKRYR